MRNLTIIICSLFFLLPSLVQAQDVTREEFDQMKKELKSLKPSKTSFMVRGYGHAGLEVRGKENTFVGGSFSPIFIWKQGDKFIFESELEFSLTENNETEVGFEYANVSYLASKWLTVRVGKFLLPFGTFGDRLHPSWVNRMPNMPLGFGHDGISPGSDLGFMLSGSVPMGSAKISYAAYVVNGPRLEIGEDEPDEAGMLGFENFVDNNNNKAVGGRIGILPISNSSMEIGVSGYVGKPGDRNSNFTDVKARLFAADFSYVRQLRWIKGMLDIKAQWNFSDIDKTQYRDFEADDSTATYTFDNQSHAYYAQVSYRPSMASSKVLKNFEVVGRYSGFQGPDGALWAGTKNQWSGGINYWFTWRIVVKATFQRVKSTSGIDEDNTTNAFFLHWAIGF